MSEHQPTEEVCFWCRSLTGITVVMPKEKMAPAAAIMDYAPCSECQEKWDAGIVFFRAYDQNDIPDGMKDLRPFQSQPFECWVSGEAVIMGTGWVEEMRETIGDTMADIMLEQKQCLIFGDEWHTYGLDAVSDKFRQEKSAGS